MVLTYSKLLPNIQGIVKKHFNVLHRSDKLKEIFPTAPLIAYKRDKNLCDVLVHAKTNKLVQSFDGDCSKNCEMCFIIEKQSRNSSGKLIENRVDSPNCRDRNVIYSIICSKCDKAVYRR